MTETDWLNSTDPGAMLDFVRGSNPLRAECPVPPPNDRKLRLFACACCRSVWHLLTDDAPCQNCSGGPGREAYTGRAQGLPCPACKGTGRVNRSRKAVEVAERFADGLATEGERAEAHRLAMSADWSGNINGPVAAMVCERELNWRSFFGEPRRQWGQGSEQLQAALLREIVGNPWRPVLGGKYRADGVPTVPRITGWLTPTALGVASAAYDFREWDRLPVLADALSDGGCEDAAILDHLRGPGPHVRGCWCLDLLLGLG